MKKNLLYTSYQHRCLLTSSSCGHTRSEQHRRFSLTETVVAQIVLRYRQIDRYSYLYSAYKSKESLCASVSKKMCFQRSSKRIEGESRPPKPGWKVVPQSRTGSRETPVAKFVVCLCHEQLQDVVGMRPQMSFII